jgi:signal transduction histidine kinase
MSDELTHRVLVETVRAATQGLEPADARMAAQRIGRHLSAVLAAQWPAGQVARLLDIDEGLEAPLLDALLRGVAEGLPETAPSAPQATREVPPPSVPARDGAPVAPWATTQPTLRELPAAARRCAHDLNQPLTVILGYAALLRRATDEAIRTEAAEQIAKEARKMSEIIKVLSRLARGLDAA